jgi:hypothetical protein
MQSKNIYIIGAGISGLIAALELEKAGYAPAILEATNEIGGRVKTDIKNGVAFDHGFQVLLSAYPAVKEYINIETFQSIYFLPGAVVFYNGKAYSFGDPLRNISFLIPTLFSPLGSLKDKWKIVTLAQHLKQKSLASIFESQEVSTLDYLKAYGFSSKIIELFFKPFYTGIFLEPYLQTSSRMFEFVFKMFAMGKAILPANGIDAVPAQLKAGLKNTIFNFNTKVIDVTNEIISLENGDTLKADGIIVTTPLPNVTNEQIAWKACTNLYFNCVKKTITKPIIGLITHVDALINNIYFLPNTNILSVTIVKEHTLANKELIARVKVELVRYCNIDTTDCIKQFTIKKALPNLRPVTYTSNLNDITINKYTFLAGDYLANGSLNAAMLNGKNAAEALIKSLA